MSFGKILDSHPESYSYDELRELLTRHGVICFTNVAHDEEMLIRVMSAFGHVQTYVEQQAPASYASGEEHNIINLDNNDFLGTSRTHWHMDQTYLTSMYLPVRSLYCHEVSGKNITQFADIKYFTELVMQTWPELLDANARYYIDQAKTSYTDRPVFSPCEHVSTPLARLDTRMVLDETYDAIRFKEFTRQFFIDARKFQREWTPGDFVIFDNNQSPHRRREMNGECKLLRFTTDFWRT